MKEMLMRANLYAPREVPLAFSGLECCAFSSSFCQTLAFHPKVAAVLDVLSAREPATAKTVLILQAHSSLGGLFSVTL